MAEKRRWGPSLGAWASAREYTAQRTSILIPNGQYRVLLSPTSPSRPTLGPPVAIGAVGPGGVGVQSQRAADSALSCALMACAEHYSFVYELQGELVGSSESMM
jgi:hypothetical protein